MPIIDDTGRMNYFFGNEEYGLPDFAGSQGGGDSNPAAYDYLNKLRDAMKQKFAQLVAEGKLPALEGVPDVFKRAAYEAMLNGNNPNVDPSAADLIRGYDEVQRQRAVFDPSGWSDGGSDLIWAGIGGAVGAAALTGPAAGAGAGSGVGSGASGTAGEAFPALSSTLPAIEPATLVGPGLGLADASGIVGGGDGLFSGAGGNWADAAGRYGLPVAGSLIAGNQAEGDPGSDVASQLALNRQVRDLNLVDQSGPGGSSRYTIGADGRATRTDTLSPELQQQYGMFRGLANQAGSQLGTPFNPNAYGQVQGAPDTSFSPGGIQSGLNLQGLPDIYGGTGYSQYMPELQDYTPELTNLYEGTEPYFGQANSSRDRVEQALLDRYTPRFEQQRADQERQLMDRLAAQGATAGGEYYERELGNLRQASGDQYRDLLTEAILQGGGEQSRMFGLGQQVFGQNLAGNQFGMQAAGQLFGQDMEARNQMFNFDQTRTGQNLAARNQMFGEQVAAGNFANQAQNQDFTQQLAQGNFGLDQAQFGNAAQQQRFLQGLQGRQQTGNELGLFGGMQQQAMGGAPGGFNAGSIGTPDYLTAQQNAQANQLGTQTLFGNLISGAYNAIDPFGTNKNRGSN